MGWAMIGLVGIQIDDFEQIETDNSCLKIRASVPVYRELPDHFRRKQVVKNGGGQYEGCLNYRECIQTYTLLLFQTHLRL